jgi:hypothetical protein
MGTRGFGGFGHFGDGGDEAVGFVEDELFEERLRGWHGMGRIPHLRSEMWGTRGVEGLFAGQERVEDLEVVEELAGADGVEIVGGDAAEQL